MKAQVMHAFALYRKASSTLFVFIVNYAEAFLISVAVVILSLAKNLVFCCRLLVFPD